MYEYPTNVTFTIGRLTAERLLADSIGRVLSYEQLVSKFIQPVCVENGLVVSYATEANAIPFIVAFGVLEPEFVADKKRPIKFIVRDPKAVRGNPAACTTIGLRTIINDCLNELTTRANQA